MLITFSPDPAFIFSFPSVFSDSYVIHCVSCSNIPLFLLWYVLFITQESNEFIGQVGSVSEGWRSTLLFSDSLRFPIPVNGLCSDFLFPFHTRRSVLTRRKIAPYCFRLSRVKRRPIGFTSHEHFCFDTVLSHAKTSKFYV